VAFGEDACGRVHLVRLNGAVARIGDGSAGPCVLRPEFTPPLAQPAANAPSRPVAVAVKVRTRIARRQKVLRRRYLTLRVACATSCRLRVTSKLFVRHRKPLRLRDVNRRGVRRARTIKVPVGRRARRAIRSALRHERRVAVHLTLRARGSSGRLAVKRLSTRIVG
jgi:hypothetical protein